MKPNHSFLEGLEPRIAPAALFTFTDVDGDVVTVKTGKGTNTDLANALTISDAGQLEKVDFTSNAKVFEHTSLDITVKSRDVHGDGFVNVGLIDATGMDINAVSIKGDLGKILAGDNKNLSAHNGVVSLSVHSLGAKGLSTQSEGDTDLNSLIYGRSNYLKVDTSVTDASLTWTSATQTQEQDGPTHTGQAGVKAMTIGKNLNGGDGEIGGGFISVDGQIGNFKLGGNIVGGVSENKNEGSGSVYADSFGTLSVGGSVLGGEGVNSGQIVAVHGASSITIGGNLVGNGDNSGRIELDDASGGTISVGGNVVGGEGDRSGDILVFGSVAKVGIGGNLIGGDGNYSGLLSNHSVEPGTNDPTAIATNVGTLSIGGSILGGGGNHTGIVAFDRVGSLSVGGSVVGGNVDDPTEENSDSGGISLVAATGISIGGNIKGGNFDSTGVVSVFGDVKTFSLKGSVIGGEGDGSGSLGLASYTGGALKSTIGGSVLGGDGNQSGQLSLSGGGTHTVAIGGKVVGGEGDNSGSIHARNDIAGLTIGGSVQGGGGFESGSLFLGRFGPPRNEGPSTDVTLQTLSIGGDLLGGGGESSGSVFLPTTVTNLTVGGEVAGGKADESGIIQGNTITTVSLGHDVTGGGGQDSGGVFYNSGKTFTLGGSIVGGNSERGDSTGTVQIGTVATVNIGGSIIGGDAEDSGTLKLGGKGAPVIDGKAIPPVTINIGGDIIGGNGFASGELTTGFNIGPAILTVGGSLVGGSNVGSGQINVAALSSLSIGGDVVGGSEIDAGSIFVGESNGVTITNVTIGGSLIGGTATGTGTFEADNDRVVSFNVLGDVKGGQDTFDPNPGPPPDRDPMTNSGFITAGTIDTLNVGGSLYAGDPGANEGDLNLGAIRVGTLGTLNVNGSIEGTVDNTFLITAQGNLSSTAKTNLAISAINVLGDVNYANILAGYDTTGTTLNGDGGEGGGTAQIGKVYVGGDWHASSLTAGTNTGESDQWGSDTNFLLTKPEGSTLIASIASIQIDGIASGDETEVQHGFVAEKIGSLVVADETYTIPPAPDSVQVGADKNLVARLVTSLV